MVLKHFDRLSGYSKSEALFLLRLPKVTYIHNGSGCGQLFFAIKSMIAPSFLNTQEMKKGRFRQQIVTHSSRDILDEK